MNIADSVLTHDTSTERGLSEVFIKRRIKETDVLNQKIAAVLPLFFMSCNLGILQYFYHFFILKNYFYEFFSDESSLLFISYRMVI